MNSDEKVQKIIQWRESFSTLPDKFFFDLIRIYLGEIKTPYNKQKLVEEIGRFLSKKTTRESVIKFLNDDDIKILTAIKFINEPDILKLENFFSSVFSQGILYNTVSSLEERLIIFSVRNKDRSVIKINPYLEDDLNPILSLSVLISPDENKEFPERKIRISSEIIAAFVCYISVYPDLCKNNGELKKKACYDLMDIFQERFKKDFFEILFRAFKNLHLIHENQNEKGFVIDWQRLEQFAGLPFENQISYICAACTGNFSRSSVLKNAELFFETVSFLKNNTYTRQKILEISFLIKEKKSVAGEASVSRFSKILAHGTSDDSLTDSGLVDSMIDSAIELGILDSKTEYTEEYIRVNSFYEEKCLQKSLSIDAGFLITVMPGFSLSELLPFTKFLNIKSCDVAITFEITKQSVIKAFDLEMKKEDIIGVLEKYSSYKIPQNLFVSLEDWASSYDSAVLYKGYVLKLSRENAFYVEKNPEFSRHIREILAPGVYLLDFVSEDQERDAVEKLGLDFLGKVRSVKDDIRTPGFPKMTVKENFSLETRMEQKQEISFSPANDKDQKKILNDLKAQLDSVSITPEQREGLENRISRRIILSSEQLRPESVRFELSEASGMNFTGKIHILESAVQNEDLVEIEIAGSKEIFIGYPKSVIKNSENSVLLLTGRNPENNTVEEFEIIIALISRVKKIRSSASIFNFISRRN